MFFLSWSPGCAAGGLSFRGGCWEEESLRCFVFCVLVLCIAYMVAVISGPDLAFSAQATEKWRLRSAGGWRGMAGEWRRFSRRGSVSCWRSGLSEHLVVGRRGGKGASFVLRLRLCCHYISAARIELWDAGLAPFSYLFSLW